MEKNLRCQLQKSNFINLKKFSQLNSLRENIHTNIRLETEKTGKLREQLLKTQETLRNKQFEQRNCLLNEKINQRKSELEGQSANVQNLKTQQENSVNDLRGKNSQKNLQLKNFNEKLQQIHGSNKNNELNRLTQKERELLNLIENRKQQVQRLKGDIEHLTKQELASNNSNLQSQINGIKDEINQLKSAQAEVQTNLELIKKQQKQIEKDLKIKNKPIQDQKQKISNVNEKVKKLESEHSEIQNQVLTILQNRKVKVQPKVPEELIQLRKQKQELLGRIKVQTQKYVKEKQLNDNSVPPTVIENMKNRIKNIIQRNQKYKTLTGQNSGLTDENKKLDVLKEKLEWEDNQEVTSQEANRKKEQAKHKALEEELSKVRKEALLVNNKLQEYQKSYPEFNPEKKVKKQQPVQQKVEPKKQQEQKVTKKGNKNNKSNKPQQQAPIQVKPKVTEQKKVSPPAFEQPIDIEKKQQSSSENIKVQSSNNNKKNKKKR